MVPNSCIFYLVNNNPIHLRRLKVSLELLRDNFLKQYPYPVIFGHEGISADTEHEIANILGTLPHYYYNVKFALPDYPQAIIDKIPEKFKGHWDENAFFSMGYRHMCNFFAGEIYTREFFSNVKYMLRIDCDSYFTDKIKEDIFETVHNKGMLYASVGTEEDMDYVVDGLADKCKEIFRDEAQLGTVISPTGMFKTHFELVAFQWFKHKDWQNFYKAIRDTGNIYIKRWGDAPIKYQGVKNLMFKEQIGDFSHLPYTHGGDYTL